MNAIDVVFCLVAAFLIYKYFFKEEIEIKDPQDWYSLPTLDEYIAQNPDRCSGNEIRCNRCGSPWLREKRVPGADDTKRSQICQNCLVELYRIEYKTYTPPKKI